VGAEEVEERRVGIGEWLVRERRVGRGKWFVEKGLKAKGLKLMGNVKKGK
jgi:hypothetical protein